MTIYVYFLFGNTLLLISVSDNRDPVGAHSKTEPNIDLLQSENISKQPPDGQFI